MKDQTKEGLALRLALFFSIPGFITFEEYSPLYFKQLGFSSSDIGLTSLSAIIVPSIAVTSIGILADRLRARKTVLFLCITISIPVILAPLLPMVVIEKICKVTTIANASHKIATLTKERSGNNTNNWSILNGVLNSRDAIVNPHVLKLSAMTPIVKNRQSDISFGNSTVSSINTSKEIDSTNLFPFWFAFVILVRMVYDILKRTVDTMLKVSVASYVTRIGGNFGAYHCWIDIGAILSVFTAGMLASSCTTYDICGKRDHGYFVTLIVSASFLSFALGTLPWMTFEYLDYRVINWPEVKGVVFDPHYIVMMAMAYFVGFCHAFPVRWEFWYIDQLSGGPVLMAVDGFTRRLFVLLCFYVSGKFIEKFGELETVAVSLFLYALGFLALSFIRIAWLVLVVDIFYAAGFAFSLSSLVVHFSKAATKASSATIQGELGISWRSAGNQLGISLGSAGVQLGISWGSAGQRGL